MAPRLAAPPAISASSRPFGCEALPFSPKRASPNGAGVGTPGGAIRRILWIVQPIRLGSSPALPPASPATPSIMSTSSPPTPEQSNEPGRSNASGPAATTQAPTPGRAEAEGKGHPPDDAENASTLRTVVEEDRPRTEAAVQQLGESRFTPDDRDASERRGPGEMDQEKHASLRQTGPMDIGSEGQGDRRAPASGDMLKQQQEAAEEAGTRDPNAAGPPPDGS